MQPDNRRSFLRHIGLPANKTYDDKAFRSGCKDQLQGAEAAQICNLNDLLAIRKA